jgi:hypothetical protein
MPGLGEVLSPTVACFHCSRSPLRVRPPQFYGLFKQATVGDNTSPKPGMMLVVLGGLDGTVCGQFAAGGLRARVSE